MSSEQQPQKVEILFQNEELMVIDKPPDVAMDGDLPLTVEKWVQTQVEYLSRPLPRQYDPKQAIPAKSLKFVHQLDSATSGVLCLAFSRDMAARVAHCFELRYTKKIYSALLFGHLPEAGPPLERFILKPKIGDDMAPTLCLPWPIGDDSTDEKEFRMCIGGTSPKEAATLLQVQRRGFLNGLPITHVLLRPMTGRRHQLRVHCAYMGYPIIGDLTYFAGTSAEVFPRLALHAVELTLFDRVDVNDDTCRQRSLDKRKRRRETLQLERHESDESVTFKTEDPFQQLLCVEVDEQ